MITPHFFINALARNDISFFTGVPDSLLKNICAYITDNITPTNNIIAANEGGAMGLAAGYHLATGKIPVVYMQKKETLLILCCLLQIKMCTIFLYCY